MNQPNRSDKTNNNRSSSSKKSRPQRSPKSANPAKKRRNNRSRRTNGPKLSGFEKVERAYMTFLEKHLEARKKYFELYHRADPRQLAKLEKAFYRTGDELREYEDSIGPEFREEFEKKFNGLKLDTTYSENHQLPVEEPAVSAQDNIP